jgi:hypothetical protein
MAGPQQGRQQATERMTTTDWRDAIPEKWVGPEGETVACVEKLKVLEDNLAEIADLAQDALEDAILMGVAEDQARAVLSAVMASLKNPYK